ncbi:hypothetical protein Daura_06515 [Dactylosporangium aurantiacum]|uniref:Uncharacterized protein n=1 Tax=Dactylosporangium aurantiacum TaxID=35754 RepID=A0A9Q9IGW8_9ACTN|nr:hypothetical protein [Dactylosporangium aurantiacum]MDG6106114.1 hypothetical protein [Dactylosporangium aurantiacum]UWZ55847.1 hypothetical protein Daura_06515 [Dactylosporangium aurantiacum]
MDSLALLATLALAGYATLYILACAAFPFGNCRRCKGTGKLRNPFFRRMFRLCPRCDGTGRRVRIGRRVYEYLRSEHRNGTR